MKSIKYFVLMLFFAIACEPGVQHNNVNNTNNTNNANCVDSDNDTICDNHEGRAENLDSDNDGIPNYLDPDSDNDGIPDSVEAGDDNPETPPVDSNMDGVPDYIDLDSDGNGIPDEDEGTGDLDGDGIPNYQDFDNDGDYISDTDEIGADPYNPDNSDDDMIPDYMDIDSDNDGIGDRFERTGDADEDGVPNYKDLDSDGDGILDMYEGGTNGDPTIEPVDSDEDSHYDFLDADSDNDGLPDGQEDVNHNGIVDGTESDPKNPDSDNDGVNDLIEVAAGTNPQDPNDNPRANGDFVFVVPFEEDPTPTEDILNFSTAFKKLDLMFVEDVSGSMSSEIASVSAGLTTMLQNVVCAPGEDPSITNCIPDVESGVIVFGGPSSPSNVWQMLKAVDNNNLISDAGPDNTSTQSIIPSDDWSGGSEDPISAMRAAVQDTCATDASRIGRGCFRPDALKLIILITDEDDDEDAMYPNFQAAWDDLVAAQTRILLDFGNGGTTDQNDIYTLLSNAQSGGQALVPTLDVTNIQSIPACAALGSNPFYNNRAILQGSDANAGPALTCAVQAIAAYIPQDVHTNILNSPSNVSYEGTPVDAPAEFIDHIEVFMAGDATCPAGYNTADGNGDTFHDRFIAILPGNPVCWKIFVKQNITVEGAPEPQMFTATVEVYGEGGAILDTRDVYFLVPPVIEGPGVVE
ncbi:hypothetical protein KKF34_11435 [Myxococcota bacterium]|nr:hypothetical protein [Myxococcota bacterium]MBU1381716.1 hypothetical protein [Myxococcota bacterium]MBU1497476.1 hypothetical protein [Myxococcota bacterium]